MRRLVVPLLLGLVALGAAGVAVWSDLQDPGAAAATEVDAPTTPVLSARRVPAYLAQPGADAALRSRLEDLVARAPASSCLAVEADDRVIVDHNAQQPLVPASTEKLLVAEAILTELGPDATFRTTAVAAGAPSGGVVDGDLYLVGSGDPVLSTGGYRQREGLVDDLAGTSLEELADAVVDAGVTQITGSVLGDERRYDTERYVAAWPDRFIDQNQTGPLSALTVNQGFESYPSEADPGAPLVPAADPPTFAAGALTNLLVQRGVEVGGLPGAGDSPPGATEVAAVDSPPLELIVEYMLATSDNTTAELLTKELGVLVGQEGSTAAGTDAIATVLGEQMLPLEGVEVVDGSGLAPTNRTTCLLLSDVLDDAGPDSELAGGLAVAGESGTLATFLDGTDVEGRLRAKTGSLNDVRSLAGFVEDLEGDTISFAFVINQSEFVTPESDALRDELGIILGTYPETPDLAAIGPLPVDG